MKVVVSIEISLSLEPVYWDRTWTAQPVARARVTSGPHSCSLNMKIEYIFAISYISFRRIGVYLCNILLYEIYHCFEILSQLLSL